MNKHIKPGQLVPAKLRLEIYKEAKRSIEADTNICNSVRLLCCCILWGLKNRDEPAPNEKNWSVNDSGKMFPEFNKTIRVTDGKQHALDELTKAIEALEKATVKPSATTKGQQSIIDNIVNSVAEQLSRVEPDFRHKVFIQLRDKLAEQHAALPGLS